MVDGYDPKNCNYWHCNTAIANLNFKVEISNILYRKQIVTHSQKVWTWHVGHSIWKITYLPSPLWTNRHDFVQDRCIIYSFIIYSFMHDEGLFFDVISISCASFGAFQGD